LLDDEISRCKTFCFRQIKRRKIFRRNQPKDVVLYGFGRIGRLLARELMSKTGKGNQLRLRAIVTRDRNDATTLEKELLLRYDSIHGDFQGSVADPDNNALIINGTTVHIITLVLRILIILYDIDNALLIDNTGALLLRSLESSLVSVGVDKVLLTAPERFQILFMV
jgi:glyceraldehyde 3-phosphate dehydrogenase